MSAIEKQAKPSADSSERAKADPDELFSDAPPATPAKAAPRAEKPAHKAVEQARPKKAPRPPVWGGIASGLGVAGFVMIIVNDFVLARESVVDSVTARVLRGFGRLLGGVSMDHPEGSSLALGYLAVGLAVVALAAVGAAIIRREPKRWIQLGAGSAVLVLMWEFVLMSAAVFAAGGAIAGIVWAIQRVKSRGTQGAA
jgi:hypothetical protein